MRVKVFWKHRGPEMYGGIEWVCEKEEEVILVPHNGNAESAPRIVCQREDIAGWHETTHTPGDDEDEEVEEQ